MFPVIIVSSSQDTLPLNKPLLVHPKQCGGCRTWEWQTHGQTPIKHPDTPGSPHLPNRPSYALHPTRRSQIRLYPRLERLQAVYCKLTGDTTYTTSEEARTGRELGDVGYLVPVLREQDFGVFV